MFLYWPLYFCSLKTSLFDTFLFGGFNEFERTSNYKGLKARWVPGSASLKGGSKGHETGSGLAENKSAFHRNVIAFHLF